MDFYYGARRFSDERAILSENGRSIEICMDCRSKIVPKIKPADKKQ
jgi:DNA-directed RNA polymerase subunit RPC12/RpoP